MFINGLIDKLLLAGAVKKQDRDVFFTANFSKHVYGYASYNADKMGTVGEWRKMLYEFDPSLSDLSIGEVAAVVTLLDYHLTSTAADWRKI